MIVSKKKIRIIYYLILTVLLSMTPMFMLINISSYKTNENLQPDAGNDKNYLKNSGYWNPPYIYILTITGQIQQMIFLGFKVEMVPLETLILSKM